MRKFVVTIDGKNFEVAVEEVTEGAAAAPAASAPAPAAAAPVAAPAPAPAAPVSGEKVASPFPGLIKSLYVKNGDTVAKDQPVLVLEAMKMDNDITAPVAGKVTIRVAPGDNVETGTVLFILS